MGLLLCAIDVACNHPEAPLMDFRVIRAGVASTPVKVTMFNVDGSPAPQTRIWLANCWLGRRTTADLAENQILIWADTSRSCTVAGYRTDGLVRAWSDDVTLDVAMGHAPEVVLTMPAEVYGGPGFTTAHGPQCYEIRNLDRRSAAHKAGLRNGDCLAKVGGTVVAGLTGLEVADAERALYGPIGTTVEITATTATGDVTGAFLRTEFTP